jgi:hypothetical protein
MTRSRPHRILVAVTAALVCFATVGGTVAADHHRDPIPTFAPRLIDVSARTHTPDLFTVTGMDFTPRGRVYLAIYDEMGAALYETRWVTASAIPFQGPGDSLPTYQDPGGVVHAAFGHLCGATAMMRALDEETAVWSTWLSVEFACDGAGGLRRH